MSVSKTSINDIARAAGISHSTVSRALSDSPLVNAETKTRIRRLAQEMAYSPDAAARSLVMGRTHTVGVVVTTIADPFAAEVVEGIGRTAFAHGYSLILAASDDEPDREIAVVEMLRSKRVDAVIVTSSRVGALHQERLGAAGVPVILLNSHSQQHIPQTFSVRVDDVHGGCLATSHLIDLGHRDIAHVAGPVGHSPSAERLEGYLAALAEAGIPSGRSLVVPGDGRPGGGEAALAALLDLSPRPTAVFCYNDMTAIGLLRGARRAGLQVPADLAVVGFDDIPFAAYVSPALTTVAQPKFELGRRAMEMALARIEDGLPSCTAIHRTIVRRIVEDGLPVGGETGEGGDLMLQGQLVIRESTNFQCDP